MSLEVNVSRMKTETVPYRTVRRTRTVTHSMNGWYYARIGAAVSVVVSAAYYFAFWRFIFG
jgi:uncharacterized membrane protein